MSSEGTIVFPRIVLCSEVTPKVGQQCFLRVGADQYGPLCNHVFVISGKEEPTPCQP
jgi:hypothetical protein